MLLTRWLAAAEPLFSRQAEAFAEPGAVPFGIAAPGDAGNVVLAMAAARTAATINIGLTGEGGGKMPPQCDHRFAVPSKSAPATQQVQPCLGHRSGASIEAALA